MVGTAREVKEWLSRTGYPLEMEVAKNLQVAGFGISPCRQGNQKSHKKYNMSHLVKYNRGDNIGNSKNGTGATKAISLL